MFQNVLNLCGCKIPLMWLGFFFLYQCVEGRTIMEGKVNTFSLRNYSAHLPVMIGDFLIEEANRSYFFQWVVSNHYWGVLRRTDWGPLRWATTLLVILYILVCFVEWCPCFWLTEMAYPYFVVWHIRLCQWSAWEYFMFYHANTLVQSTTDHYISWEWYDMIVSFICLNKRTCLIISSTPKHTQTVFCCFARFLSSHHIDYDDPTKNQS